MSSQIKFAEVANLINRSGSTFIDTDPIHREKERWEIFKGLNKVPAFEYPFYICYLSVSATLVSIERAVKYIKKDGLKDLLLVYAPSLKLNIEDHINIFEGAVKKYLNTCEYFLYFIRDQLDNYLAQMKRLEPDYWIDPPIEVPSGFRKRIPNPVLSYMLMEDVGQINRGGSLSVLQGEPGQGKTYMAKHLSSKIAMRNLVPIYINSDQWYTMQGDDITSLWKTFAHSFRFFEAPIGWIEGYEEEFLRVALKVGVFRIIFDGFDEYVLWNQGKIGALDALRGLMQLAENTDSRILITSRTSFWESEAQFEDQNEENLNHYIYKIKPFDINHAKNYFIKWFPEDTSRQNRAVEIFGKLRKGSEESDKGNFAGRGFVLHLIADLINRTEISPAIVKGTSTVAQWMMRALCEREEVRQKLPLNADQQLDMLRNFAEETSRGVSADSELLKLSIATAAPDLSEEEAVMLVEKSRSGLGSLADHPLIRKKPESDIWEFIHEQIRFYFLAERIMEYAQNMEINSEKLKGFLSEIQLKGTLFHDIATAIIDQLCYNLTADEAKKKILNIIKSLCICSADSETGRGKRRSSYLSTTCALLAVNQMIPVGQERKQRAQDLSLFFPNGSLKNLYFSGTISSMDFSNIEFENCTFNQVTWKNCKFNEKTKLNWCQFIGGRVAQSQSIGLVSITDTKLDKDARQFITNAQIKEGKKKYTIDDLRNDISQVIRKFVLRIGIYKNIEENNMKRGTIALSKYRNEIIEVLSRFVIEYVRVGGEADNYYTIKKEAKGTVDHFLSDGVFTGGIALAFEQLREKLKL